MQTYTRNAKLMGNNFAISVVAPDGTAADGYIDMAINEIKRIEALLTTFNNTSQTSLINENAGIQPVKVDAEVLQLIKRSIAISTITQGAFDITYGSIDKSLWNFDRSMTALPSQEDALKMVHLIDYKNIVLNEAAQTVYLKNKGMRIGFGGIGKGYAAEMAKQKLVVHGVKSGIVNASGDLTAWGLQPDGREWVIGISDPDKPENVFSYLQISGKAVATSGNYEKYVMIGGKKYSHTIDPKTGLPITGIKSVTIIANNAEFADAMATPISIMGIKAGLYLVEQIPELHCIIIDDNNKMYTSGKINLK
jgi:FAD:protein FMN transferase